MSTTSWGRYIIGKGEEALLSGKYCDNNMNESPDLKQHHDY